MNPVRLLIRAEQRADLLADGAAVGVDLLVVGIVDHGGAESRVRGAEVVPAPAPLLHGPENPAVAADDLETLKERVQAILSETRAWFSLRQEVGELLARSVSFFSPKSTKEIGLPDTTWPVTSRELALMLSPLGLNTPRLLNSFA